MSVSRGTASRDRSERLVSDLLYDLPSGSEDEGEAESDSDSIQPQDILEETNEASSSSECEDDAGASTVITTNRVQSQKEQLQALLTKDLVWESKPFSQQGDLPFTGSESMPDCVKNLDTPYQFFSYFFDDDLIEKIVAETRLYSVQKDPSRPFSVSSNEVKKYLGILILTSVIKISNIRAYWSPTLGIHLIQNTMSVNTFERIRQFLHFNDTSVMPPSDHPDHDKLYRLRPVISAIRQKFLSIPIEQRLAVDEQICATKVKHHLKQYNPSKPHKWGFKVYLLSGASGCCNDFEIYTGREKNPDGTPDLGACANIVVRLSQSIPNEKHFSIYFDNYFTTIKLLLYLKQRGIQSLGTFRSNRFPGMHLVEKKERGEFLESTTKVNDEEICAVSWFDNKVVNLASTYVGGSPTGTCKRWSKKERKIIDVARPKIVEEYNSYMGSVDLFDSLLGRQKISMKSKKWYMRIFYHLVDMAVVNAWLLCKRVHSSNPLTMRDFRVEIATCLCMGAKAEKRRGRPSADCDIPAKRAPRQPRPPTDVRADNHGHWPCVLRERQRCKNEGCQKKSSVYCVKCEVFLCLRQSQNCFREFHHKFLA